MRLALKWGTGAESQSAPQKNPAVPQGPTGTTGSPHPTELGGCRHAARPGREPHGDMAILVTPWETKGLEIQVDFTTPQRENACAKQHFQGTES